MYISGDDPLIISSFCAMGHTRAHNRAAGAGAARVIRAEAGTSRTSTAERRVVAASRAAGVRVYRDPPCDFPLRKLRFNIFRKRAVSDRFTVYHPDGAR